MELNFFGAPEYLEPHCPGCKAKIDYGVVIDPDKMTINREETKKLRKDLGKMRGQITWTFDRGGDLGKE